MSNYTKSRVIIQKRQRPFNIYYPLLSKADIKTTYPWNAATADVDLVLQGGDIQSHLSNIHSHDYIRVQVTNTPDASDVAWKDLFAGSIFDIDPDYDLNGNKMRLVCVGFDAEMLDTTIKSTYNFTGYKTGEVLRTILANECEHVVDAVNSRIREGATTITTYDIKADTKYVGDVVRALEQFELYGYRYRVQAIYDERGRLKEVIPIWEPVPDKITSKYSIVYGTFNTKMIKVKLKARQHARSVTVYGSDESVPQRVGRVTGGTGTLDIVETDTSLGSDTLCQTVAQAMFDRYKEPLLMGDAVKLLEPDARAGDLVKCYNPHIRLNNKIVDYPMRIMSVNHQISDAGAITVFGLGEVELSFSDIMADLKNRNRLNSANFIV